MKRVELHASWMDGETFRGLWAPIDGAEEFLLISCYVSDPAWEALAAYHLAGIRSGRVRPDDWAFVPLRRPGDPSFSETDLREAFDVYLQLLRERL